MAKSTNSVGLVLCGVLLAGCGTPSVTSIQEGTKQATQGVKENYELLKQNMKEALTYKLPDKTPKPIPPSYCYRVMLDIVCYHHAVAGAEGRLVAYQGMAVEPEAAKQASAAVAAAPVVQQGEAAPVAPVEATASAEPPSVPSPMDAVAKAAAASDAPSAPTPAPLTMTDDEKAKAEKSMAHFDGQKPVAVGAEPAVKADTGAAPK